MVNAGYTVQNNCPRRVAASDYPNDRENCYLRRSFWMSSLHLVANAIAKVMHATRTTSTACMGDLYIDDKTEATLSATACNGNTDANALSSGVRYVTSTIYSCLSAVYDTSTVKNTGQMRLTAFEADGGCVRVNGILLSGALSAQRHRDILQVHDASGLASLGDSGALSHRASQSSQPKAYSVVKMAGMI